MRSKKVEASPRDRIAADRSLGMRRQGQQAHKKSVNSGLSRTTTLLCICILAEASKARLAAKLQDRRSWKAIVAIAKIATIANASFEKIPSSLCTGHV